MTNAYYVELTVHAVVMAENDIHAERIAGSRARDILRDCDSGTAHSTLIESLSELRAIDSTWSGEDIPYGGDGDTRLKDLLPEEPPFKDTQTTDMFGG